MVKRGNAKDKRLINLFRLGGLGNGVGYSKPQIIEQKDNPKSSELAGLDEFIHETQREAR